MLEVVLAKYPSGHVRRHPLWYKNKDAPILLNPQDKQLVAFVTQVRQLESQSRHLEDVTFSNCPLGHEVEQKLVP